MNVDAMMDAGWNLQGEAYKALVWGAVNSKIKAVIGSPPSKGLEAMREGWGTNVHDARYHKELEILAKQLFLFLLSYTANDGLEPALELNSTNLSGHAFSLLNQKALHGHMRYTCRSLGLSKGVGCYMLLYIHSHI